MQTTGRVSRTEGGRGTVAHVVVHQLPTRKKKKKKRGVSDKCVLVTCCNCLFFFLTPCFVLSLETVHDRHRQLTPLPGYRVPFDLNPPPYQTGRRRNRTTEDEPKNGWDTLVGALTRNRPSRVPDPQTPVSPGAESGKLLLSVKAQVSPLVSL